MLWLCCCCFLLCSYSACPLHHWEISPNMWKVCFFKLFFLSCLPSQQQNNKSKAVCGCEWLKTENMQCDEGHWLLFFCMTFSLYGFSLHCCLFVLFFFVSLCVCLSPSGLPPPPAIAKRGLKARGKQKLLSHHTYRTHIHFLLLKLNISNIIQYCSPRQPAVTKLKLTVFI